MGQWSNKKPVLWRKKPLLSSEEIKRRNELFGKVICPHCGEPLFKKRGDNHG